MKLEELMEMAKGKSKRKQAAKNARKKKADKGGLNAKSNPVLKAMGELEGRGQGAHPTEKDKTRTKQGRRKQDKKEIKNQMDS